jgi:hypothetical protein
MKPVPPMTKTAIALSQTIDSNSSTALLAVAPMLPPRRLGIA